MLIGEMKKWPEAFPINQNNNYYSYMEEDYHSKPKSQYICDEVIKMTISEGFLVGSKVMRKKGTTYLKQQIGTIVRYETNYEKAYKAYSENGYEVLVVNWDMGWEMSYDPDDLILVKE